MCISVQVLPHFLMLPGENEVSFPKYVHMRPKKIIATVSAHGSNLKLHVKSSCDFKQLLSHLTDIYPPVCVQIHR